MKNVHHNIMVVYGPNNSYGSKLAYWKILIACNINFNSPAGSPVSSTEVYVEREWHVEREWQGGCSSPTKE
jgi:hypothetical protein